jgi:hypothetical protein
MVCGTKEGPEAMISGPFFLGTEYSLQCDQDIVIDAKRGFLALRFGPLLLLLSTHVAIHC